MDREEIVVHNTSLVEYKNDSNLFFLFVYLPDNAIQTFVLGVGGLRYEIYSEHTNLNIYYSCYTALGILLLFPRFFMNWIYLT